MHAAIIEFNALADAVRPAAEDNDFLFVDGSISLSGSFTPSPS
jgi:hypothetical protein